MESRTDVCREILNSFLERWPIESIQKMSINEYVYVGDKDTFCQWLENRTRLLGSINGLNSSKFGIYKRGDINKKPKRLVNDNTHSWMKFYSLNNQEEAFKNVNEEIQKIIEFSKKGSFNKIDDLHLQQMVKWKIAYLYSNERLIPIFNKETIVKIAKHFGMNANFKTPVSEIQKLMIENKPAHLSIYEYSDLLYQKFGKPRKEKKSILNVAKRTKRKPSENRNTTKQERNGGASYIANQKHNILQEKLKEILIQKHGAERVILEENYVDIKVIHNESIDFYEVKSDSYAGDCIKNALGQILSYVHHDEIEKTKKIYIAGQYSPNQDEIRYINFIKENINIHFDYLSIDI